MPLITPSSIQSGGAGWRGTPLSPYKPKHTVYYGSRATSCHLGSGSCCFDYDAAKAAHPFSALFSLETTVVECVR